jgi:hypothetical protein
MERKMTVHKHKFYIHVFHEKDHWAIPIDIPVAYCIVNEMPILVYMN